MTAHTHRPQDARDATRSRCISCGKAIQKVAEAPDRMAYWRTVR